VKAAHQDPVDPLLRVIVEPPAERTGPRAEDEGVIVLQGGGLAQASRGQKEFEIH